MIYNKYKLNHKMNFIPQTQQKMNSILQMQQKIFNHKLNLINTVK